MSNLNLLVVEGNIEEENKVTDKNSRMQELKNWLEYLNEN